MTEELPERPRPFEFAQPTEMFTLAPPSRKGKRVALSITLGIGIPVLLGGAGAGYLVISAALADVRPQALSADQQSSIQGEISEHADLLAQLDDQRAAYDTAESQWDQSLSWAQEAHGPADQPSVAVANPGGDALPGDDPYGRAFLDSIGATDVVVVFDAGPDNCGFYGNSGGGDSGYVYAGGCFRADHANTLYMAWDSGAEDIVWPIFVHEAMHWFQAEHYVQDTYLADFAGIDASTYNERWEADASCRAVYVYGMSISDYEGSSSPCTIDGWYEGFIADYLTSLGANLVEPDPATYELAEASRP